MSADITEHPEGTLIRVTGESVSGDAELDEGASSVGAKRTVYTYAPPGEGDDPNGKPYYLLDTENSIGGAEWAYPENVEVVKTVTELRSRRPPTAAALKAQIASAMIGGFGDVVDIDETDAGGDHGEIYAYGRTHDGLRVAFRVLVDEIEEVDM